VRWVVAGVVQAELSGRAAEVLGELLDTEQISSSCSVRLIATLDVIEHQFA
jgi:hypothetical protein